MLSPGVCGQTPSHEGRERPISRTDADQPDGGRPLRHLLFDRLIAGLCSLWINPTRLLRSAIALKPSTLLNLHLWFSGNTGCCFRRSADRRRTKRSEPGCHPYRCDMKQHNPMWGCPRIAEQIALAFDVCINKDVVRRILAAHYYPSSDGSGPSWLTFIGHLKDSLHSIDLFRCESVALRTYWVLVVLDQYTRRIIGFGIPSGIVD
jgi:putative transposase